MIWKWLHSSTWGIQSSLCCRLRLDRHYSQTSLPYFPTMTRNVSSVVRSHHVQYWERVLKKCTTEDWLEYERDLRKTLENGIYGLPTHRVLSATHDQNIFKDYHELFLKTLSWGREIVQTIQKYHQRWAIVVWEMEYHGKKFPFLKFDWE